MRIHLIPSLLLISGLVFASPTNGAENNDENYNLLYVPTPQALVNRMLQLAKIEDDDVVYDLGSGDGRVVITAAKRYGVEGVGVDLKTELIEESRVNAKRAGVEDQVTFHNQDLFDINVSDASVVALYLLPEVMTKLRSKLLKELKPGSIVVSHDYTFNKWQPDRHLTYGRGDIPLENASIGDNSFEVAKTKMSGPDLEHALASMPVQRDIYFWIVPVRAEGTWQWHFTLNQQRLSVEMNLDQRYQELEGAVKIGDGANHSIENGRVSGRHVHFQIEPNDSFKYERLRFTGILRNGELRGTVFLFNEHTINQQKWTAERPSKGIGEWGS